MRGRKRNVAGFGVAIGLLGVLSLVTGRKMPQDGPAATHEAPSSPAALDTLLRAADVANGGRIFARCAACHSIGQGGPDLDGPNLYGVVGARIAGRGRRFAYTAALRHIGGSWDFGTLDTWLTNPKRFAPGTSMAFAGLAVPRERADVIAYLNTQGSNLPLP